MAKYWDDEQDETDKFECDADQYKCCPEKKTLERVEAHEAVFVVGREKQKDDRRNEREVGQRAGNVFGKDAHSTHGSRGLHRAAAAGAECGGLRHRGSAVGAWD